MNKIILIYILSLLIQPLSSQIITSEKMINDINFYFNTIKNNHPFLYNNSTKLKFESIKTELEIKCKNDLNIKDFNRILLTLNQYTDGHTKISDKFLFSHYKDISYFPHLNIKNDTLLFKDNILISINNINVDTIFKEIKTFSSYENSIKLKELETSNIIPKYLSVFHNMNLPYKLKIKEKNGYIYNDTLEKLENRLITTKEDFIFKFYTEESIAVLFFNTFDFDRKEQEFTKYINLGFDKIKKLNIKYLFIDIRLNGGGTRGYIYKLLDHIKPRHSQTTTMYHMVNKSQIEDLLKSDYENIDKYFTDNIFGKLRKNIFLFLHKKAICKFKETGIASSKIKHKKVKPYYKGNVYLIQGRESYSAAIEFTEEFKRRNIGLIIGEEGGASIPFSGGAINRVLPNSKIAFSCSTIYTWFKPSIKTHNGFILPDIKYKVFNRILSINDYKQIIDLEKKLKK